VRLIFAAAAAATLSAAPTGAATITTQIGVIASAFDRIGAPSAETPLIITPNDPFDPSAGEWRRNAQVVKLIDVDTSADFALSGLPPSINWRFERFVPSSFDVIYTAADDRLRIFGSVGGLALSETENDMRGVIEGAFRGQQLVTEFVITSANSPGGYWSAPAAFAVVPEPASWAMMLGGFGLMGGALRARRRTHVVYA